MIQHIKKICPKCKQLFEMVGTQQNNLCVECTYGIKTYIHVNKDKRKWLARYQGV